MCSIQYELIITFVVILSSVYSQNTSAETNDTIIEIFNNCKCVEHFQCDGDNFIIQDGATLIDIRLNVERIPCTAITQVCCKLKPKENGTSPELNTKNPTTNVSVTTFKTKKYKICGMQLPNFDLRIFTDSNDSSTSLTGEFPWIASIFRQTSDKSKYKFKCSGSLIHPGVVLTVYHCAQKSSLGDYKIIVSGSNELGTVGSKIENERNLADVVRHPDFYSGGLYNDIALLFLDGAYNISNFKLPLNTICLPERSQTFDSNSKCIVAGWGKGSNENQKIMKKVSLPIVDRNKCQELLRQTRLGAKFRLHESFICAGGEENRDACEGDGGSPLMCKRNNRYVQAGIVSWGIDCAKANRPGIYTDVSKFIDWINKELEKKGLTINKENS